MINPVNIQSTPKTPDVILDNLNGLIEIKGMSCAEYALEFYKPIFEWLDVYIENPNPETVVNIQYKYFNTSSAKCILQMLEKIVSIKEKGKEVVINWYYKKNDEQMFDDGENYGEILGVRFQMIETD